MKTLKPVFEKCPKCNGQGIIIPEFGQPIPHSKGKYDPNSDELVMILLCKDCKQVYASEWKEIKKD